MSAIEYDVIVVGSGFGGAVAACRLAEAGRRVLVLERGRRWTPDTYPRDEADPWLWSQRNPQRFHGWADLRVFSNMSVVAAAGVGGGSLIYANVSVEARPDAFDHGWPPEITYEALEPFYQRVGWMLSVQEVPDNQISERTRLLRDAADACGWGDRYRKLPLAVSFSPTYDPSLPGARDDRHSVRHVNVHGVPQGTCVHCGNCDIGCQVSAKNTLDLNYLAVAERRGAKILPLHVVQKLEPLGQGWRVHFNVIDPAAGSFMPGTATAATVIVSAGSIGSTELLLRCRDEHRTLPNLSPRLGWGWAFNGDFVTPAFYRHRKISPSHGVTISAAIDLLDRTDDDGEPLFIEDGGVPNLAHDFVRRHLQRSHGGVKRTFWRAFARHFDCDDPVENMMPWFGQAIDPGDGRMRLGRCWFAPWRRELRLDWSYTRSEAIVDAMVDTHRRLSTVTGGTPFVPPTWSDFHKLITPHPLGGCNMGLTRADGVVNADGKVFGYDGLYVMDGATIPRALGLNPSRTIAALAERNVAVLLGQGVV
ncbi:GMC oxidoreductase [Burkholderia lata]|uniref:GMC oxidoreductase n=1 Tax=Burkholderia lata (strain ATCC 17760 / DSM 23089 / LMG 22485 / NCIMB 9086 / R18194 / 383) TaxID=482957 RepID=UPI0014540575|nr:GMC family oxidoreductase [Burkholderia lata]VWB22689.1 iron-sulfur cluster-binding domain-containing protein [Burkholderia lata]